MILHIAEEFLSVQGEGYYTGTPMYFLRLAGCSVGKPLPGKPAYIEECTLYDGRTFLCDTNFRRAYSLSIDEVVAKIPTDVKHISITGGEPLNQHAAVKELVDRIRGRIKVHVETSGTVDVDWLCALAYTNVWITVSPKKNVTTSMICRADEIKFLVDQDFVVTEAEEMLFHAREDCHIWLQPVNFERDLDMGNVIRCTNILVRKPEWKLSVQLHKVIGVR